MLYLLFLNIWLLKSETSLLVKSLQIYGEEQCQHAEACEYNEWYCVVVRDKVGASIFGCDNCRVVFVGRCKEVADEFRHEAKANVLYPEDKTVGRTKYLLVNNLRYAWALSGRHESERDPK